MTMLCRVYTHPVLVPNEVEHFNVGSETFSLEAPDLRNRLPSVPGDANMTEVEAGRAHKRARERKTLKETEKIRKRMTRRKKMTETEGKGKKRRKERIESNK